MSLRPSSKSDCAAALSARDESARASDGSADDAPADATPIAPQRTRWLARGAKHRDGSLAIVEKIGGRGGGGLVGGGAGAAGERRARRTRDRRRPLGAWLGRSALGLGLA